MAKSVQKLPSEVGHATDSETINTESNLNPLITLQDFSNQISEAYPEPLEINDIKRELLIASFGVLNLVISKIIISLPYFNSVHNRLNSFYLVLFSLLGLGLAAVALKTLFIKARQEISEKLVSLSVCQALAVITGGLYLIYTLLFDFSYLHRSYVTQSYIGLIFILACSRYLESLLFRQFTYGAGYDLGRTSGKILKINDRDPELKSEEVKFNEVKTGDLLIAHAGSQVCFDGEVIDGIAQAREVYYCPKGKPGLLTKSDKVFSGTQVLRGKIVYRVTALQNESLISNFSDRLNSSLLENASAKIQAYNSNQTVTNLLCIFFAVAAGIFWLSRFQNVHIAASVMVSILLIGLSAKFLHISILMNLYYETCAYYRGIFYTKSFHSKNTLTEKLVLDFESAERATSTILNGYSLIDKRVDESTLPSVLFSLAGRGIGPEASAVTAYITEQNTEISLYECTDFNEFNTSDSSNDDTGSAKGFYGNLAGADFTVGNEDFLLERGVLVQASEIDENDQEESDHYSWYVALKNEVIARLDFSRDNPEKISRELNILRAENIRAILCSRDDDKMVDELAKSYGFELADIYGGMSEDNYSKKLESLKPFSLYYSKSLPEKLKSKAELTISVFDELRFNLDSADVLLFDREFKTIFDSVLLPVRSRRIEKQNLYISGTLSLMLLGLAVMNFIPPLACAIAVGTASLAMLMNCLKLRRF